MGRRSIIFCILVVLMSSVTLHAKMPAYTTLTRFLIDLEGWTASDATGMSKKGPMGEMVSASRQYKNEEQNLNAQIMVGVASRGAWSPFQSGYTIDSPETYVTTMDVSGHKVGINHDKKENAGSIVVQLNTRSNTAFFVLSYEGMSYTDALRIACMFSWKDMGKAAK